MEQPENPDRMPTAIELGAIITRARQQAYELMQIEMAQHTIDGFGGAGVLASATGLVLCAGTAVHCCYPPGEMEKTQVEETILANLRGAIRNVGMPINQDGSPFVARRPGHE